MEIKITMNIQSSSIKRLPCEAKIRLCRAVFAVYANVSMRRS